jgi:hypothetical protein
MVLGNIGGLDLDCDDHRGQLRGRDWWYPQPRIQWHRSAASGATATQALALALAGIRPSRDLAGRRQVRFASDGAHVG